MQDRGSLSERKKVGRLLHLPVAGYDCSLWHGMSHRSPPSTEAGVTIVFSCQGSFTARRDSGWKWQFDSRH